MTILEQIFISLVLTGIILIGGVSCVEYGKHSVARDCDKYNEFEYNKQTYVCINDG